MLGPSSSSPPSSVAICTQGTPFLALIWPLTSSLNGGGGGCFLCRPVTLSFLLTCIGKQPKQTFKIYEWFPWIYSLLLASEKYKKTSVYILLVQQLVTLTNFLLLLPPAQSVFFTLIDMGGRWGSGVVVGTSRTTWIPLNNPSRGISARDYLWLYTDVLVT